MTIEQQAAEIVRHWMPRSPETWDDIANAAANQLANDNLLAPEPRIIRTIEELEALDPETVVQRPSQNPVRWSPTESAEDLLYVASRWGWSKHLPAVVIATGDQVRAARKALQEES